MSSHPAARLPPAKKPVIVRSILDKLGGASDGVLMVMEAPHKLGNSDIDLAARLITGQAGCHLPVVYVSCGFHGGHIIDVNSVAANLAGMAHVVVEPNRPFSLRLKIEVDSENVYGGTIGVYWPDGGGRRSFFFGYALETPEEIQSAVFDEVRIALTNRRPFVRCTWPAVQESASRRAYNALKEAGSREVDKYIGEFDKELTAKDEQLTDAEKEIARLRAEVRKHEARNPMGAGLTLRTGCEQDLYARELEEIVLDALSDSASRVPGDSRRQHVLVAVLNANTSSGEAGKRRESLKNLLRDYSSMDARTRKGLLDMGFQIEEEGKHFKLSYQGDDRYIFSLPKSGSDHRGGLNAASDISRLLF